MSLNKTITSSVLDSARAALLPFLVSRAIVLLILLLTLSFQVQAVPAREGRNFHLYGRLSADFVPQLKKVLLCADSSWYLEIARDGYAKEPFSNEVPRNWVFFPLFPLLMRALAAVLHSFLLSGLLISNLSFYLALVAAHLWTRAENTTGTFSSRLLWVISLFPTAYFYSAPMTESLFLLLAYLSLLAVARSRLGLLGGAAALLALCRPTGLLLLPALLYELYSRSKPKLYQLAAVCLLPFAGLAIFGGALYKACGNPGAFFQNQAAWGRGTPETWAGTWDKLRSLQLISDWNFDLLNWIVVLLALALTARFFSRRQIGLALMLLFPLLSLLGSGTLFSLPRILMPIPALHVGLAELINTRDKELSFFAVSAALLALMVVSYALLITGAMA